MPFEVNLTHLFQEFNPSKFVVYICVLVFALLFALRLDGTIGWSYWAVFLPIWIWKILVIVGSISGSCVWWRHPHYRMEGDAYTQYKAMIVSTGMHLLLLMFELLACDKLENEADRKHVLWVLVFIPLVFMSILSIGICVWAIKHERSFELELFCSVNILQFIFLALQLDGFIHWQWVIVFIPIWIVMCVALIGVLYAIILAIILLKSPDIIPEQRRGNIFSAVGYTCIVIPLLIFQILLAYKEDGVKNYTYIAVTLPLFASLFTLILLSFGAKSGNHWWFGLRRDFCSWLLGICPVLQEYGNISYRLPDADGDTSTADIDVVIPRGNPPPPLDFSRKKPYLIYNKRHKKSLPEEPPKTVVPILSIELPD